MEADGSATFAGAVTTNAGLTIDRASFPAINFEKSGTREADIFVGSTNTLQIRTNDTNALIIDASQDATFAGDITATSGDIQASSGHVKAIRSDTGFLFRGTGTHATGYNGIYLDASNNTGDATDRVIRYDDDTNSDLFYVDGTGAVKTSGVYVGGITSANLLDDYEEGTWTPVVSDASSSGNEASLGTTYGKYTKIGNRVFITISIVNITTTGMTAGNTVYITGLPFPTITGTNSGVMFGVFTSQVTLTNGACSAYQASGATSFSVGNQKTGGGSDPVLVSDLISGSADIRTTYSYETSA
jgi:hypothetical protein